MTISTKIRSEYDYILQELKLIVPNTGKEYDITNHMGLLTYEEDLFSGRIHGSLLFLDALDYVGLIPIIGEEKIKFKLTRQDAESASQDDPLPPIEFEGQIYIIEGREIQSSSNKVQAYILKFISDGFMENLKSKVHLSWKSKLYSEIVKDIHSQFITTKPIEVEETKFLQNYITSGQSPFTTINQIADRSSSAKNKHGSSYVYYESRDSYRFVTIASLFDQEPIKTLRHESINFTDNNQQKPIERNMNAVESYHHTKEFDAIDDMMSGNMSSSLLLVDPIRQKFETITFNLDEEWDNFKHLEKHKPYKTNSVSPESRVTMIISDKGQDESPYIIDNDPHIRPHKLEEVIQKRDSQFEQMRSHVITLTLPGDPRVKVGDIIDFKLPEIIGNISETNPEELDKFLQGKYLIISIAHVIEDNKYSMNLEIVKDSFYNEIFHREPSDNQLPKL